jgi:hypothetical protein
MATTLYLPSSGSPPLASLAVNTNWERTNGLVRLPCFTAKQNTSLATTTMAWPGTTTVQWCWWQFQSEQLLAAHDWTTADTVSMVIGKCSQTTTSGDTHLAYVVRVVSEDGSVIRGVIGLYHATSTEYPLVAAAATRIHSARVTGATTFSSEIGDRIIVEIGLHGFTPTATNITMRIGDPSATGDFALTAGLTTDLCPWVRLSRTVTFGVPPVTLTVQEATHSHYADGAVLTQNHNLTVAEDNHAQTVDTVVLTQVHNLTTQECTHIHTADNTVLEVQSFVLLVVQDAGHVHGADTVGIIEHKTLAVQDTNHINLLDSVVLVENKTIAVQETNHYQSADNVVITEHKILSVQDCNHTHTIDSVDITEHQTLIVSDVIHTQSCDAPALIQHYTLSVTDSVHSHSADNVSIIESKLLSLADILHNQYVDSLNLTQVHLLSAQETLHAHLSDSPDITEYQLLSVQDILHEQYSDNIILNLSSILEVQDILHGGGGQQNEVKMWDGYQWVSQGYINSLVVYQ